MKPWFERFDFTMEKGLIARDIPTHLSKVWLHSPSGRRGHLLQQLDDYGAYMVYILLFLAMTVLSRFCHRLLI